MQSSPFSHLQSLSFHSLVCHFLAIPFLVTPFHLLLSQNFIHGDKEKGMTHLPSLSCYLDWKVIDVACE